VLWSFYRVKTEPVSGRHRAWLAGDQSLYGDHPSPVFEHSLESNPERTNTFHVEVIGEPHLSVRLLIDDKYYWEDFPVGKVSEFGNMMVTHEAIVRFAQDFDPQLFHADVTAAEQSVFGASLPAAGTPPPWLCA
jgi:hypothetical protein